jgi:hypothetical protein
VQSAMKVPTPTRFGGWQSEGHDCACTQRTPPWRTAAV